MVIEFDILAQDGPEQFPVVGLFLDGMGEKEIFFSRDQGFDGNLLYSKQHITILHIENHRDSRFVVLLVFKDTDRGRFCPDFGLRKLAQDFLTGCWGQDHPVVRGVFAFPDQSEYHARFWYEICAKIGRFKRVCKYRYQKGSRLENPLKKRYLCNPIATRPRI
jgi:hypothetical protein